ncbi:MAG: hypothetical protein ABI857_13850 [Acidobacteriota bacterium]
MKIERTAGYILRHFVAFAFVGLLYATTLGAQTTIRWQGEGDQFDSRFENGMEVKMIDAPGLRVTATLIERKRWIPHAFITIENTGDSRVLVDPASWILTNESAKVLKSKEPDKLAESLDSRGRWSAALSALGGAMATKQSTATIRSSDGTTSTATITEPDEAARARGEATGRRTQDTLASAAIYVRESSLRVNTVMPAHYVYGIVWFEDKGYKDVILKMQIGDTIYEFPFTKKKK